MIKNKEALKKIAQSNLDVSEKIKDFGVYKLAKIYGRYKLILLAFKHANKNNIGMINKITKKSKSKLNKTSHANKNDSNYFQTLLSDKEPLDKVI